MYFEVPDQAVGDQEGIYPQLRALIRRKVDAQNLS